MQFPATNITPAFPDESLLLSDGYKFQSYRWTLPHEADRHFSPEKTKFFARINLKNIAEGDFMVDFSAQYRLIGARIAYFRKLKRYTQEELAFRASISTSYLSRIERGIYSKGVPISTLMQISKALDIDIKLLFEEKI